MKKTKTSIQRAAIVKYLTEKVDGATTAEIIEELKITNKRSVYHILHTLKVSGVLVCNYTSKVWTLRQLPAERQYTRVAVLREQAQSQTALQWFEALAKAMGVDVTVLLKEGYRLAIQDIRKIMGFPRDIQFAVPGDCAGVEVVTGTNERGEAVADVIRIERGKPVPRVWHDCTQSQQS